MEEEVSLQQQHVIPLLHLPDQLLEDDANGSTVEVAVVTDASSPLPYLVSFGQVRSFQQSNGSGDHCFEEQTNGCHNIDTIIQSDSNFLKGGDVRIEAESEELKKKEDNLLPKQRVAHFMDNFGGQKSNGEVLSCYQPIVLENQDSTTKRSSRYSANGVTLFATPKTDLHSVEQTCATNTVQTTSNLQNENRNSEEDFLRLQCPECCQVVYGPQSAQEHCVACRCPECGWLEQRVSDLHQHVMDEHGGAQIFCSGENYCSRCGILTNSDFLMAVHILQVSFAYPLSTTKFMVPLDKYVVTLRQEGF